MEWSPPNTKDGGKKRHLNSDICRYTYICEFTHVMQVADHKHVEQIEEAIKKSRNERSRSRRSLLTPPWLSKGFHCPKVTKQPQSQSLLIQLFFIYFSIPSNSFQEDLEEVYKLREANGDWACILSHLGIPCLPARSFPASHTLLASLCSFAWLACSPCI